MHFFILIIVNFGSAVRTELGETRPFALGSNLVAGAKLLVGRVAG